MSMYECMNLTCREEVDDDEFKPLIEGQRVTIRCPKCGYKLLRKKRPAVVTKHKAV